jgi:hypothetical protein
MTIYKRRKMHKKYNNTKTQKIENKNTKQKQTYKEY